MPLPKDVLWCNACQEFVMPPDEFNTAPPHCKKCGGTELAEWFPQMVEPPNLIHAPSDPPLEVLSRIERSDSPALMVVTDHSSDTRKRAKNKRRNRARFRARESRRLNGVTTPSPST